MQLRTSGPNANGVTAVARAGSFGGIYVARSQAAGAAEDGIYRVTNSETDDTAVALNADLDLVGLTASSNGDLCGTSGKNGSGTVRNKIIRVVDPTNAATLQVVADPFAGPNPLFSNGDDGGLGDILVGEQGDVERIFVVNNSFNAADGERIGRYNLSGSDPVLVFTEAGLIASPPAQATPTSAFSAPSSTGYLTRFTIANQNPNLASLFLASRATGNGQAAIFELDVRNLPTPSEAAAAAAAGYAVEMANPVRCASRSWTCSAARSRSSPTGARAAESEATFDASGLAPGVYHVVLRAGGVATTRSVTVVR